MYGAGKVHLTYCGSFFSPGNENWFSDTAYIYGLKDLEND